jgi:5'-phosphate synthase pdxT subunit
MVKGNTMNVGVLALQGAFIEHIRALNRLGVTAREVRSCNHLDTVEALIIPGGESTTIGKLLVRTGLYGAIRIRAASGMSIWGTCAGMILLGADVGDTGSRTGERQPLLRLMDLRLRRNAFGAQLESFETTLEVPAIADYPVPAIFIRAPVIEAVGAGVDVLARLPDGRPVAARQGQYLATAFHPELTDDLAWHRYFVTSV